MSYGTFTQTYTVVDIRKAFEGFEADLRMIARRTEKWNNDYVDKVFHDIIKLAEAKYISKVSIVLYSSNDDKIIQAATFTVNESGTGLSGGRAGSNDWANIPGTYLSVVVNYTTLWGDLGNEKQLAFMKGNGFKIPWSVSTVDTNFPHLTKQSAQTYASNGYEIAKHNYK